MPDVVAFVNATGGDGTIDDDAARLARARAVLASAPEHPDQGAHADAAATWTIVKDLAIPVYDVHLAEYPARIRGFVRRSAR